MERAVLIDKVREILGKSGFYVSKECDLRGISFDIIARKDDTLLIIKVLTNVDAFNRTNAEELKTLASSLNASPLLIGRRSGAGLLEEGVVYTRFSIPVLTLGSFSDFFIDGVPPFIFAAPGGLYVHIDNDVLRKVREKNISLGTLAKIAGVSRRTIQMYEEGMGAMVEVALRLEYFLGEPIILPIDPFSFPVEIKKITVQMDKFEALSRSIFSHLTKLGYKILLTDKCPFDAVTKDKKIILLTGIGKYEKKIMKKARVITNISKIVEKDSVFFVERKMTKYNLEGTPLITRDELKKIDDPEKILELIIERRE